MRKRINSNIIASSDSSLQPLVKYNKKNQPKTTKYFVMLFGKKTYIKDTELQIYKDAKFNINIEQL